MEHSNVVEYIQSGLRVALAALIGVWHGFPQVTQLLLCLMACDVALGSFIAVRDSAFDYTVALRRLTGKLTILVMLAVAAVLTPYSIQYLGFSLVQSATVFYLTPELASIAKNAATLGVPSFPGLSVILDRFSKQEQPAQPTTPGDSGAK